MNQIILSILLHVVLIGVYVYSWNSEGFRRNPSVRRNSMYSYSYVPSNRRDKYDWRWRWNPWSLYPYGGYSPYGMYPYPYGFYDPLRGIGRGCGCPYGHCSCDTGYVVPAMYA